MGGSKHNFVYNEEAELIKKCIERQWRDEINWPVRWGWILKEYKDMKAKLDEISNKSVLIQKEERTDFRSLKPFPNSVNHEYGWVCTKEDFRLEKYGSDVPKPTPILD